MPFVQGETKRAGSVQAGEEEAWEGLTKVCRWEGMKKREPDPSQ